MYYFGEKTKDSNSQIKINEIYLVLFLNTKHNLISVSLDLLLQFKFLVFFPLVESLQHISVIEVLMVIIV